MQCYVTTYGSVQGCGGRRAGLLQVDVLRGARELHKLLVIQLEGFPEKTTPRRERRPNQSGVRAKRHHSPNRLSQRFGGVLRHKHVAGESLVCGMFRNEAEIPAEAEQERDLANGKFHQFMPVLMKLLR